MSGLASFHKQQLLTDFTGLRECAPDGVYLSLAPNNTAIWWGVMFMRHGPYEGIPLKFSITFPNNYPHSPPHIIFHRPPPHPLITPIEMKLNVTGTSKASNASFFPGSFSLRHGFPAWFSPDAPTTASSGKMAQYPDAVDLIWYIWSAFTDKVLDRLPESCAVDDHTWQLWNNDREFLMEGLQAYKTEDEVYRPWIVAGVNGDDIPIRFMNMDEEDLDLIKRDLLDESVLETLDWTTVKFDGDA